MDQLCLVCDITICAEIEEVLLNETYKVIKGRYDVIIDTNMIQIVL